MPFIEIRVPKFNRDNLEKRLRKTLDRRGRRNENLLLRTTQYFETVKPIFTSEFEKDASGDWHINTAPIDDESGQIWSWLDQGTSVRYAWMSEGYVAGTMPRTFETAPSKGQRVSVTPNVPADPEGIEAREWTNLLSEQEVDRFAGELQDTIKGWLSAASGFISG